MIPVKVQCGCGQRYVFDVEPVNGRMPTNVACPACGADGTAAANDRIAQALEAEAAQAPSIIQQILKKRAESEGRPASGASGAGAPNALVAPVPGAPLATAPATRPGVSAAPPTGVPVISRPVPPGTARLDVSNAAPAPAGAVKLNEPAPSPSVPSASPPVSTATPSPAAASPKRPAAWLRIWVWILWIAANWSSRWKKGSTSKSRTTKP